MEISIQDLAPLIKETVDVGGTFKLFPKGKSMYPTVIEGKDAVLLGAPQDIKVYDAVFYRRRNGAYVLHRAVRIRGDIFTMCGDNQWFYEKNIHRGQIIAKLTGIIRDGETVDISTPAYRRAIRRKFLWKTPRVIATHIYVFGKKKYHALGAYLRRHGLWK